jgi:hypothetical protein
MPGKKQKNSFALLLILAFKWLISMAFYICSGTNESTFLFAKNIRFFIPLSYFFVIRRHSVNILMIALASTLKRNLIRDIVSSRTRNAHDKLKIFSGSCTIYFLQELCKTGVNFFLMAYSNEVHQIIVRTLPRFSYLVQ